MAAKARRDFNVLNLLQRLLQNNAAAVAPVDYRAMNKDGSTGATRGRKLLMNRGHEMQPSWLHNVITKRSQMDHSNGKMSQRSAPEQRPAAQVRTKSSQNGATLAARVIAKRSRNGANLAAQCIRKHSQTRALRLRSIITKHLKVAHLDQELLEQTG